MAHGAAHLGPEGEIMTSLRLFVCTCAFLLTSTLAPSQISAQTPFGANLFQGNFAAQGRTVAVTPGDRIVVRIWGGNITVDEVLQVDGNGKLDIPGLGSLTVAGIVPDKLPELLRSKLAANGHEDSQTYMAPLDAGGVAIFVTGGVNRPGRYSGLAHDPILAFLDKAGGINAARGSFRKIQILRQGEVVQTIDLYPFVRRGEQTAVRLMDGDTVVVTPRGAVIEAKGAVSNAASFEFVGSKITGAALMDLAEPRPDVTHATLSGTRKGAPYTTYVPVSDFATMNLYDGDEVQFMADGAKSTIMVEVQGAVRGATRFPVRKGARLRDVQDFIAVEPGRSNLAAIHVKRKSVAASQKRAIADSLRRLEQSAMTTGSGSHEEAQIRAREAEMIAKFVERAKTVEPDGIVVLDNGENSGSLVLEDGDCIVIPEKSDVVMVSGEVVMPKAMLWHEDKDLDDYIAGAGGFGARADHDKVLVMRPNGSVTPVTKKIGPGDHVLVLPKPETKSMQTVKDVSQVLMQVAVSTGSVLGLPFIGKVFD